MKRLITTMLIALTIFTLCSGIGAAAEITVEQGNSIQDAVNRADSGDIIIVKPGTYSGIIEINTENLTIRSESGNPEDTIIQANSDNQYLFWVRANNTTISGFKVTADRYTGVTGIRLSTCSNCTITDNRADSNRHGIVLENKCCNNNLTSNHVNSNTENGFYLTSFSSNNSLINNTAQYNRFGFYLINSSMNIISGNDVSNNTEHGMWISLSNNNTISGNTANETIHGISLDSSDGNIVFGNIVSLNNVSGLYMCKGSDNNTVFNNYLNNTFNTDIQNYNNTWNTTKTEGKNIIGGPYIAGNFWAKPDGSGFSENAKDSDLDGIADTKYEGTNFTDYLPLVLTSTPEPVLPVAKFNSNVSSGYAPLDVEFTDSSENADEWFWDFENDGSVDSTDRNTTHTYSSAGTYTVNLTVRNGNGTNSTFGTITALSTPEPVLPVAKFNSNVSSGYAPLDVEFTDSSENADEWYWDFENDGTVDSTDRNTTHTYSSAGTYTVNLTVRNGNGTNSTFGTITALSTPEPVLPVANFSSNVSSGYAPLSVQFTDSSKNATSWNWDFNDGSSSTKKNPLHTFYKSGTYTVNLTVRNVNGTDYKLATIYVLVKPQPVLPTANFSSNVSSGYAPLDVQFNDSSKNATRWNWDFENDGKIDSTDRNPMHTYSSAGTYTVNLTAINSNGTDSTFGTITVLVKPELVLPVADFSSNVSEGYAPLSVQFNDSSKNATRWNWDFGDGSNSTEQNPMHTYSSAGTYTVNLTAGNENGTNSKLAAITVLVKPELVLPVADFSTSVTGGYAPLSVTFTDRSQNATSRSWDVNGDGIEDSNDSSFIYEYVSPGTYTAKLTAINAKGKNEKTAAIIVDRKSIGGSSGGSSGGGGGGGSPEPAKNVEVKELSQVFITSGNHVKFNFPKNVTAVVYLSFDPRKTAGKTTAIVEMLKNQSTLTPDAPQGEVYSYLNIWVGNGGYANEKNIENATVCFRVKKSWLEDKDINWSSILLNRYSDKKWNELPTTLLREDNRYLYFVSETPGFSPFAITAEKAVIETLPETESSEQNENIELDIEKNTEKAENTGVSQIENSSTSGSGMIYFIIGLLVVLLLGGFLYRKDKLK